MKPPAWKTSPPNQPSTSEPRNTAGQPSSSEPCNTAGQEARPFVPGNQPHRPGEKGAVSRSTHRRNEETFHAVNRPSTSPRTRKSSELVRLVVLPSSLSKFNTIAACQPGKVFTFVAPNVFECYCCFFLLKLQPAKVLPNLGGDPQNSLNLRKVK